jgi:hypothetical protein
VPFVRQITRHIPSKRETPTIKEWLIVSEGSGVAQTREQSTQKRNEQALQRKLDAVADALADLMEHFAEGDPGRQAAKEDLSGDMEDLRAAVGLEGEM